MDLSIIGKNIRYYRKQKKLTQKELADKMGLSKNYICQIELGNKAPSLKSFKKIVDALEVSADLLLSESLEDSCRVKPALINNMMSNLSIENKEFIYSVIVAFIERLKNN